MRNRFKILVILSVIVFSTFLLSAISIANAASNFCDPSVSFNSCQGLNVDDSCTILNPGDGQCVFFKTIDSKTSCQCARSSSTASESGQNLGTPSTSNTSLDSHIGLGTITIPVFTNFIGFDTKNASILTWITFVGALATIGLVIFWVYLMIKAGVKALQSQGSPEGLEEAFKQVRSILIGAAVSLFFPLVLSIVGVFFGIGSIFNWPKMFELCTNTQYNFYFQAYLDRKVQGAGGDPTANADAACAAAGS